MGSRSDPLTPRPEGRDRSDDAHDPRSPPAIVPPFTAESAVKKVRAAEDAWNSRDPVRVSLAYTEDSTWRNRSEFVTGRDQIQAFLARKVGAGA